MSGGTLSLINKAARALAEARELPDLNAVRIVGEAAIRMAKQYRDVGIDAIIDAQVIVRTAERRMGKELAQQSPGRGGDRRSSNAMLLDLSSFGISKMQSSRFQTEHRLPDKEFHAMIEVCREKERDLTQSALVARVKKSEKEARDAEAAVAAAQSLGKTKDDQHVYRGNSFELTDSIPDASCALIFTDPPYDEASLPLYDQLGELAARILVDGGSLITYCGQYAMPQVIASLGNHIKFYWPLCCLHTGKTAQMKLRGIKVKWKPMLWFVKGTGRRDPHTWVEDLIVSQQEKDAHPWQQSVIEARYYIETLTKENELVVDPFCGGGTTAIAAKELGRQWWTADINATHVQTARKRLHDA